jgi:hypothetical protein
VQYAGVNQKQENRPEWQPPRDKAGKELAWLPLNRAWLRKHDNRAFLYLQNW